MVNLDRCAGSCNTLNDLSNKLCVPNKTADLNLSAFNMIKRINGSKTLTKYISCECKCKFDGRKCNSNQKWNNDKCCPSVKIQNNIVCPKKIIFGILLDAVAKMLNI